MKHILLYVWSKKIKYLLRTILNNYIIHIVNNKTHITQYIGMVKEYKIFLIYWYVRLFQKCFDINAQYI